MNLEEMEAAVHFELYDFLNDRGFYFNPNRSSYRKITPFGFQNVHLRFFDYGEDIMMNVLLELRFDVIEDIISPFIPPTFAEGKETPTIQVPIGTLNKKQFTKFMLSSLVDVEHAAHSIKQIMLHRGSQFLEQCNHVQEVDRLINTYPDRPSPYVSSQDLRCFKGLAAAIANKNKNFNELAELYMEELKKMSADPVTVQAYRQFVITHSDD